MIDHGQLTIRDYVSYFLAKRRGRKVCRHVAPEHLTYIVISDREDGQGHLVSVRAALRTYREGFERGFTAVCRATVHSEETGRASGPALNPVMRVALCELCVWRLPEGAYIRGEPRRRAGELPVPRGERN